MKILVLSLLVVGFVVANDNKTASQTSSNATIPLSANVSELNNINDTKDIKADNNSLTPNQQSNQVKNIDSNASINKQSKVDVSKDVIPSALSADEKLKNDIITFDRVDYIKNTTNIEDPFIYVYPQSEDDLATILKVEQAVLVLNGIFEDKASINNTWVGKDDQIEGWTVSDIKKDRVELRFRTNTRVLYVYSNNSNLKIR